MPATPSAPAPIHATHTPAIPPAAPCDTAALIAALREHLADFDAPTLLRHFQSGHLASLPADLQGGLPRMAASMGRPDLLQTICENSHAMTLIPDENGRDVLHCAAQSGNPACVRYAVERLGMRPTRGDCRGVTALDLAHRLGHAEVERYLEERAGFTLENSYRNPVRRGFYPDPSVVRVGEDYYMVNSTFVQFPCLPISHSRDLVHWQTIGHAITDLASSGVAGLPGGHGYWAPDISYYGGRFWVVATLRRDTEPFRLQMITSSERPEGPYDPPRFIEADGIDPSLFTDVDGRRYLLLNPGTRIMELAKDGTPLEAPSMLYFGSSRVKTEGPHLLYHMGWYYLFQAEGGTGQGHTETVARSRTLRGVYEPCPYNPILARRQAEPYIRRGGHGKPVQLPDGRWYMLYLCGRDVDGGTMLGRETALDPMTWTQDGWPIVNGLQGPSSVQRMPLPSVPLRDETPCFIAPRTDPRAFAREDERGWRLQAGALLSSRGEVSALLHRQSERAFTQRVTLRAAGMERGIAGLCGYYDERSFYLFGLERGEDGFRLTLMERCGEEETRRALSPWESDAAELAVEADGARRVLLYREAAGEGAWREAAALNTPYLCDEGVKGGKRFTGATLGMAAVGAGQARFEGYQARARQPETMGEQ